MLYYKLLRLIEEINKCRENNEKLIGVVKYFNKYIKSIEKNKEINDVENRLKNEHNLVGGWMDEWYTRMRNNMRKLVQYPDFTCYFNVKDKEYIFNKYIPYRFYIAHLNLRKRTKCFQHVILNPTVEFDLVDYSITDEIMKSKNSLYAEGLFNDSFDDRSKLYNLLKTSITNAQQ